MFTKYSVLSTFDYLVIEVMLFLRNKSHIFILKEDKVVNNYFLGNLKMLPNLHGFPQPIGLGE